MGLDINGTKFLLYARKQGISFDETAMVGRQIFLIDAVQLESKLKQFGFDPSRFETEKILAESDGYIEPFLKLLGANSITSFDASDYENASVVHDFNQPIPAEYRNKFSTVLDGGTLEHVFNFPAAIKNCMEMVKIGGHFLGIAPANNYLGHGFYQFSPELFFRIFTPENGFEMQQMLIYEETFEGDWYEVADPDAVKERVVLINDYPSLMLIMATKIADVEIFAKPPQQSDYFAKWNSDSEKASTNGKPENDAPVYGSGASRLAIRGWKHLQRQFNRSFGMLNRRKKHFRKIDLNS